MKKSLNNSAHILGKLGVIMLGLFFLPQVSYGAVVYDHSGDNGVPVVMMNNSAATSTTLYAPNTTKTGTITITSDLNSFTTLSGNVSYLRVERVSGVACSSVNVSGTVVAAFSAPWSSPYVFSSPSAGVANGSYCDFSITIPSGSSLGAISLYPDTVNTSITLVGSNGGAHYDGNNGYIGLNGFAFQLCDSGGCSGGFAPPVNTTLNKPVASSTISGFDNWNVTWTNTNESRADIFWFASSTVATDCQTHMTTGTGYDWLYYCPWATATNGGMHYKQGSVSYSSGTWTRDEPNNVQFTNGTWYAFSGLYDYTTNSYVAVSAITDFTINFNANYDVSTSTVTTAPFSTGTASSTLSLTGSSCATSGNLFAEAICVAFTFLFVPADSTLGQFSNLYSYMQSRFPWTYYYQIADVIGGVHYDSSKADASPTYAMNYHSANLHIASSTIGNFLPDFTAFSSSTVKQYFPAGTFDILKALAGTAILLVFFADMFFLMRNFFR